MTDLVTWLRTQLDEDERVALRATAAPWRRGEEGAWGDEEAILAGRGDARPACVAALGDFGDAQSAFDAEHIARWDPARVLTEVKAKRSIVDDFEKALARRKEHPEDFASAGALLTLLGVLKTLAVSYADRPGYEPQGWKYG